jgi:hypothetical protein
VSASLESAAFGVKARPISGPRGRGEGHFVLARNNTAIKNSWLYASNVHYEIKNSCYSMNSVSVQLS